MQHAKAKNPSTGDWINEVYIYTLEYYSTIKGSEVPTHATMWMNLKNIMLSERRQTQKTTSCMIPFIWNVQNRQIHGDKVSSSWGRGSLGEWELTADGASFKGVWKCSRIRLWCWLHNSEYFQRTKNISLYTLSGRTVRYVSSICFIIRCLKKSLALHKHC